MTTRLYYTDSYLTAFDAEARRAETDDGRPAAILDRTAFYPTSGGQPFDTGRLGAAAVIEVVDREDGEILHILDRPLEAGAVQGTIDWVRRFDHMQQHTGQHLLSAAFDRLFQVRTESFHLGPAAATIDLARLVSAQEIEAAEDEVNRVVSEDRPVTIRFADAGEAASLPLRKASAREGQLRIIDVEAFDVSACGGTHVARTGGVGMVAALGSERVKQGTRLEFVCGGRALRAFRLQRSAVAASVRLVSVIPEELPAGIERLQAEARDSRRLLKDARARLAVFEADALALGAVRRGDAVVAIASLEGWDQAGLKSIASAIAARPAHVAMLFSAPPPCFAVIARAADASFDCAAALAKLVASFGGKGGGRPDFAQGGGLQGSAADLTSFATSLF